MAATSDDAPPDGRKLRRSRNHEAIVQATIELVREGHVTPAVEDVARRAKVGERTVFRQFQDLETLYRAIYERVHRDVLASVTITPPSGDLEADLRALVGRRARVFEELTPFRRAGRAVRHRSPFLKEADAYVTRFMRAALEAVVIPHLRGNRDVLEALDALLSFETWDRMRDQQGLGARRAEVIVGSAAISLARAARDH